MPLSPLSSLRSPVLTDTANVVRDFSNLTSDLDGRVHNVCTRTSRPSGSSAFAGALIYESDTKMWRTYDGSRWQWVGGAKQIRAITLPSVLGVASSYVTFPVLAGSGISAQTNDPDSAMSIVTTAGGQGIKCEVAGVYQADMVSTSSANSANALATLFLPGGAVSYGPGIYGPSGATMICSQAFIAGAGEVVIPKVYTYSGTQTFTGTLVVTMLSEK